MVLQMTVPGLLWWGDDGVLINNDALDPVARFSHFSDLDDDIPF